MKRKYVKGKLKKWTEARMFQTFVHGKVLLWLIFCFIFKLNIKWLEALELETLPVMTLGAGEKIKLGRWSLVWWSTVAKLCQCLYQFIIWKNNWERKQYYNSIFIQGFHPGNVNSFIKTTVIKALHILILVQVPLKWKK